MDVWLHVGTGKTGSSALQVAFARHRAALAAAGLVYPVGMDDETVALEGGITSGNAKRLGWLVAPRLRPPGFDAVAVERWLDAVLDEAGTRPVLFSSETLQAPDPEAFGALVARIRAKGRRVRILYLVRHALDHAVASYAQGLKIGRPPPHATSLADFLMRHETVFLRQIQNLEAVTGPGSLVCRLYDAERLGEGGLPRGLLRCIDPAFAAALPEDAAPAVVNRSPTGLELELFERLARHPEDAALLARLVTRGVLNAPPLVPAEITVPEEAFAAFAARNAGIVAAVNARCFGGEEVLRLTSGRIRIGEPVPPSPAALFDTAVAMLAGAVREARREGAGRAPAPQAGQPRMRAPERRGRQGAGAAAGHAPAAGGGGAMAARVRRLAAAGELAEALRLLDAALREAPAEEALLRLRRRLMREWRERA